MTQSPDDWLGVFACGAADVFGLTAVLWAIIGGIALGNVALFLISLALLYLGGLDLMEHAARYPEDYDDENCDD